MFFFVATITVWLVVDAINYGARGQDLGLEWRWWCTEISVEKETVLKTPVPFQCGELVRPSIAPREANWSWMAKFTAGILFAFYVSSVAQ